MPRLCPTQVISHRLELGTAERKQLKEAVTAYNRDKWLENIPNFAIGAASVVAGVGVVGIGYAGYKAAVALNELVGGNLFDFIGDVKDGVNRVKNIPSAMSAWWYWRMYNVWPDVVVPPPYEHDPTHEPFPAPTNQEEGPTPWSVMALTHEEWLAAGMPMDAWTDWAIHHSGAGGGPMHVP